MSVNSSNYEWTILPSAGSGPSMRYNTSSVIYKGHLYLICGAGAGSGRFSEVWSYNIKTSLWGLVQCSGDIPPARDGHSLTYIGNGEVIVYGGQGNPIENVNKSENITEHVKIKTFHIREIYNDMYSLDLNICKWQRVSSSGPLNPLGRKNHSAIYIPSTSRPAVAVLPMDNILPASQIKPMSAHKQVKPQTHVEPASPTAQSQSRSGYRKLAAPVEEKEDLTKYNLENCIIIFGGYTIDPAKYSELILNDTWAFSLTNGTWFKVPVQGNLPRPTYDHKAELFMDSNVIAVFGGFTSNNAAPASSTIDNDTGITNSTNSDANVSSLLVFNLKKFTWKYIPILNDIKDQLELKISGHSIIKDTLTPTWSKVQLQKAKLKHNYGSLYIVGGKINMKTTFSFNEPVTNDSEYVDIGHLNIFNEHAVFKVISNYSTANNMTFLIDKNNNNNNNKNTLTSLPVFRPEVRVGQAAVSCIGLGLHDVYQNQIKLLSDLDAESQYSSVKLEQDPHLHLNNLQTPQPSTNLPTHEFSLHTLLTTSSSKKPYDDPYAVGSGRSFDTFTSVSEASFVPHEDNRIITDESGNQKDKMQSSSTGTEKKKELYTRDPLFYIFGGIKTSSTGYCDPIIYELSLVTMKSDQLSKLMPKHNKKVSMVEDVTNGKPFHNPQRSIDSFKTAQNSVINTSNSSKGQSTSLANTEGSMMFWNNNNSLESSSASQYTYHSNHDNTPLEELFKSKTADDWNEIKAAMMKPLHDKVHVPNAGANSLGNSARKNTSRVGGTARSVTGGQKLPSLPSSHSASMLQKLNSSNTILGMKSSKALTNSAFTGSTTNIHETVFQNKNYKNNKDSTPITADEEKRQQKILLQESIRTLLDNKLTFLEVKEAFYHSQT